MWQSVGTLRGGGDIAQSCFYNFNHKYLGVFGGQGINRKSSIVHPGVIASVCVVEVFG